MAEGDIYKDFVGVVAFDPRENEWDGRTMREVTVEVKGNSGDMLRVSIKLYDNYPDVAVAKGDLVFGRGKFVSKPDRNSATGRVFYEIQASSFGVVAQAKRTDTQGSSGQARTTTSSAPAADDTPPW